MTKYLGIALVILIGLIVWGLRNKNKKLVWLASVLLAGVFVWIAFLVFVLIPSM
ncbi:hypothetical protein [Lapidilactobacillus bayanensis]|uniref:hypothetical protein n=1 Tax=Lapidilactobacillus bayanensis TaxID=2485998 RepID=UPI0013DDD830|nr:hypothetical protein [Lapidilactobacillus bayanensis]